MDEKQLFGLALGLTPPWFIDKVTFDPGQKRLDLFLDFKRGSKFPCPECASGEGCPVHDTTEKTWRHLDFFQHQAFLTARVPRIECPTHGVRLTNVPWARPSSGFTLLFEALALLMCQQMPVAGVAKVMQANANTLWRLLKHYVDKAVENADYSDVRDVGTDECAQRKGHVYITTFCDLEQSRVVFVAEGRRKVDEFLKKLGYRFVLRELTHTAEVRPGGSMLVNSIWENKGVAPIYHPWPLAYRLRSSADLVVASWKSTANLMSWLPGIHEVAKVVTIPAGVPAGKFALDIAFLSEDGKTAHVELAIAGKRTDKWYPVSEVTIKTLRLPHSHQDLQ